MKCLITGGTGFLGRHLVPHLKESGASVIVLNSKNCDLTNKENLLRFNGEKLDRIYHLAAWTKAGDFCLHHKGEQWVINQLINTNVLWFWRTHQPQALMIAMGSGCAYPPELDLKEENYMVGEPDRDLYTYAMTKRMVYAGLQALHHQFGMQYRYLVPSTLFGPLFDQQDNHFIFDLIKKISAAKKTGGRAVLWGDGNQTRELLYIQDAISLIDLAVEHCPNDILNLGSGMGHSIRQYAEMICEIIGFDPERIDYDTTHWSGVSKKVFNPQKIHDLFKFKFTDLKTALAETITYHLSTKA